MISSRRSVSSRHVEQCAAVPQAVHRSASADREAPQEECLQDDFFDFIMKFALLHFLSSPAWIQNADLTPFCRSRSAKR